MNHRRHMLIPAAALVVVALYLGMSAATGTLGFPLDDAWIHQTYARNLVRSGHWEFIPGIISSGSTAPLWTLLLAVGYLVRIPYLIWANLLGVISLVLLAQGGMRLWGQLWPEQCHLAWLAGLAMTVTWPLAWAALSGMETLLFPALGIWILVFFTEYTSDPYAGSPKPAATVTPLTHRWPLATLGILMGLLILTRPDGVVLLLLIAVGLSFVYKSMPQRALSILKLLAVTLLLLTPYLLFNLKSSGHIWPNTFYAKQTEYAASLQPPLLSRLGRVLFFSLGGPETGWRGSSGPQLFLMPGIGFAAWLSLKSDWTRKRVHHLLPLLWAGGHLFLYAWRLPLLYQHGRYLAAALPIWVLYGISGWQWILVHITNPRIRKISTQVAGLSFVMLLLVFSLLGAQAYAQDVAFIEGEMVSTAQWLEKNTAEDAIIATHDIGAIGYFAERPLLDLAGLITPEIIPLLADPNALSEYVISSNADYLVTAPGWTYEEVATADDVLLVYSTEYVWTLSQNTNNMTVYRLPKR